MCFIHPHVRVKVLASPEGRIVFGRSLKVDVRNIQEQVVLFYAPLTIAAAGATLEECYGKFVHEMFRRCKQVAMADDADLNEEGLEFKERFWDLVSEVRLSTGANVS